MSASEDLGRLLRLLEPHLGAPAVEMEGDGFATFYASLLAIKRDVAAMESTVVPPRARVSPSPPWGWGDNVVSIETARGARP